MTAKAKQITSTTLITIICLVLVAGGIMKLIGAEPEQVVQFLTKAGFGGRIKVLGVTELLIASALTYPKTNKIGFLLACCYLGGAFCLELSGGQVPASAMFLTILWIGMFLKDKHLFLPSAA